MTLKLSTLLFLGGPIIVSLFQLPDKFQLVYGLSGLDAGVRLIPFSLAVPFGSGVGPAVATKLKIPALFVIIAGAMLQVIGFALLGTLPDTLTIPDRMYGFEILSGFGCGLCFTPLFLVITGAVDARDRGKFRRSASRTSSFPREWFLTLAQLSVSERATNSGSSVVPSSSPCRHRYLIAL